MRNFTAIAILCAAALSACSTAGLTGLGADSTFNCKAPSGVACMSVSGISANANRGNLPAQRKARAEEAGNVNIEEQSASKDSNADDAGGASKNATLSYLGKDALASPRDMEVPYTGMPLRSPPKVARIWIAPTTDSDQDLHDQRFVFVTVHTGKWMVEATNLAIERQFRPVYQLGGKKASEGDGSNARKVSKRQATQDAIETAGPSIAVDQSE